MRCTCHGISKGDATGRKIITRQVVASIAHVKRELQSIFVCASHRHDRFEGEKEKSGAGNTEFQQCHKKTVHQWQTPSTLSSFFSLHLLSERTKELQCVVVTGVNILKAFSARAATPATQTSTAKWRLCLCTKTKLQYSS